MAPYKLIGLAALSVESAMIFVICKRRFNYISAPLIVLMHSIGLYSAAGTCLRAAA